ncbi:MAG: ArsR/SmtB family transcription factor [Syntrophothermus sp.]
MSFTPRQSWLDRQAVLDDPRAMRALAHPIRLEMLEYLGRVPDASATECSEHVAASPSACSYHLRTLAKWGLVEGAPSTDGRERRWRKVSQGLRWTHRGRPDALPAMAALRKTFIDRDLAFLDAYIRAEPDLPLEWQDALYSQATLVITAQELEEVGLRLFEILEPYFPQNRAENPPEGAREVNFAAFGVPRLDR